MHVLSHGDISTFHKLHISTSPLRKHIFSLNFLVLCLLVRNANSDKIDFKIKVRKLDPLATVCFGHLSSLLPPITTPNFCVELYGWSLKLLISGKLYGISLCEISRPPAHWQQKYQNLMLNNPSLYCNII